MGNTREIGVRLDHVMEKLDITSERAASEAHMESDDVKQMRRGRKKPSNRLLIFLESHGARISWILEGIGDAIMPEDETWARSLAAMEEDANSRYFKQKAAEYQGIVARLSALRQHEGYPMVGRGTSIQAMFAGTEPPAIELLTFLVEKCNYSGTWLLTGRGEAKERPWTIRASARTRTEALVGRLYDPKWAMELQAHLIQLAENAMRPIELFQRYMRLATALEHPELHRLVDQVLFRDETGRYAERLRGFLMALQQEQEMSSEAVATAGQPEQVATVATSPEDPWDSE